MVISKKCFWAKTSYVLDDLANDLAMQLGHDTLIELIKELDLYIEDYDFTKELRDHFVREIEKEDAAEAAIATVCDPEKN